MNELATRKMNTPVIHRLIDISFSLPADFLAKPVTIYAVKHGI